MRALFLHGPNIPRVSVWTCLRGYWIPYMESPRSRFESRTCQVGTYSGVNVHMYAWSQDGSGSQPIAKRYPCCGDEQSWCETPNFVCRLGVEPQVGLGLGRMMVHSITGDRVKCFHRKWNCPRCCMFLEGTGECCTCDVA